MIYDLLNINLCTFQCFWNCMGSFCFNSLQTKYLNMTWFWLLCVTKGTGALLYAAKFIFLTPSRLKWRHLFVIQDNENHILGTLKYLKMLIIKIAPRKITTISVAHFLCCRKILICKRPQDLCFRVSLVIGQCHRAKVT